MCPGFERNAKMGGEGREDGRVGRKGVEGRGVSPAGAVGSPGSVKVIWINRSDPNGLL